MEKRKEVEDNWLTYFHSIKKCLPLELRELQEGQNLYNKVYRNKSYRNRTKLDMDNYDAVVYLTNMSVDELDKFVDTEITNRIHVSIFGHIQNLLKAVIDRLANL